jgi:site-specific recombinase XerD
MNHYFSNNCLYTDFTISNTNCGVAYQSTVCDERKQNYTSLLASYSQEIEYFRARIGKDRSSSTLKKHESVRKHLSDFIFWKTGEKDIGFEDIGEDFISSFCNYLMEECGLSRSTAWVYQIPLKHLVSAAFNRGVIQRNPFAMFHLSPDVKERSFLSESELRKMMDISLTGKVKNLARDLFVLSCWTGLSFVDMKNLTKDSLVERKDEVWIISQRQKTKKPFQIKLLEPASAILKRYARKSKSKYFFKTGCYNYLNVKLKEIAEECGIKKKLSFHCARHTFATMAINNGMSIESVSQILGHSSIKTTQIYTRITVSKLDNDFTVFNDNVKAFF